MEQWLIFSSEACLSVDTLSSICVSEILGRVTCCDSESPNLNDVSNKVLAAKEVSLAPKEANLIIELEKHDNDWGAILSAVHVGHD